MSPDRFDAALVAGLLLRSDALPMKVPTFRVDPPASQEVLEATSRWGRCMSSAESEAVRWSRVAQEAEAVSTAPIFMGGTDLERVARVVERQQCTAIATFAMQLAAAAGGDA